MLKPAPLVGGGKAASSSDKNPKIPIDLRDHGAVSAEAAGWFIRGPWAGQRDGWGCSSAEAEVWLPLWLARWLSSWLVRF